MSKKYLLDTNICVFLLRGKYNVDKYIDKVGLDSCFVSVITIAELKFGAELMRRKGKNYPEQNLDLFIDSISVLPIDSAIDLFADEKARLQTVGTPSNDNFDLLIGCTAIANDCILVTENTDDFKNLSGIRLENWIKRK